MRSRRFSNLPYLPDFPNLPYNSPVELIAIPTPLLHAGDDLAAILAEQAELRDGDILVVSSKAVATTEGAAIDLNAIEPGAEANDLSKRCGHSPAERQALLDETERMHGHVVGTCPQAVLTELKPAGLMQGSILAATAGLDHSNTPQGTLIGWPKDPVASVGRLRRELRKATGADVAVILSDSCCRPRRLGVTAIALTVSGIDPIADMRGERDLFGKPLQMTQEARADQLATSANILMGNAGQSTPAVIVRDHGIPFSSFEGWVEGIEPSEDLFHGVI